LKDRQDEADARVICQSRNGKASGGNRWAPEISRLDKQQQGNIVARQVSKRTYSAEDFPEV